MTARYNHLGQNARQFYQYVFQYIVDTLKLSARHHPMQCEVIKKSLQPIKLWSCANNSKKWRVERHWDNDKFSVSIFALLISTKIMEIFGGMKCQQL